MGNDMGIEDTRRSTRRPVRKRSRNHVYNGFPHYTTLYEPAHCICVDPCCNDENGLCTCKTCPCKYIPHGTHTAIRVQEVIGDEHIS